VVAGGLETACADVAATVELVEAASEYVGDAIRRRIRDMS
jgi:hypothetical protein